MVPYESQYSYRGVLQIQINKVTSGHRGAIPKSCNSEKEQHLLIEVFIKLPNTSLLGFIFKGMNFRIILQLKTMVVYFNIKMNLHQVIRYINIIGLV